jgi:KDO2-lipid IV(A) lauroyltransferase
VGAAAAAILPGARQNILHGIRLIRGSKGPVDDAVDVARTFGAYAGCLAETLSNGGKNAALPEAVLVGRRNVDKASALGRGILIATIHSGGWEVVGPLLVNFRKSKLVMVMEGERDREAREIQDRARRASGLEVVHVGEDPLSSLPILRHLRDGHIVAMQIDRVLPGMRSVTVKLFGGEFKMPLGPFRLAQVSGAPLVPMFAARTGFRQYVIEAAPPVVLSRKADDADIARGAQAVAHSMSEFLRDHPTQWFHFRR